MTPFALCDASASVAKTPRRVLFGAPSRTEVESFFSEQWTQVSSSYSPLIWLALSAPPTRNRKILPMDLLRRCAQRRPLRTPCAGAPARYRTRTWHIRGYRGIARTLPPPQQQFPAPVPVAATRCLLHA